MDRAKFQSNDVHTVLGYAMLLLGLFFWVFGTYACFFSKVFMPYTGHIMLDWIKDESYYIAALPSYLLTCAGLAAWNWFSMKFFRHT